jgi:F-type H+-transporting ATPase subunit a
MSAVTLNTLTALPSADIEVGVHHTLKLFGITFNVDTIWCTLIAGGIIIVMGLLVSSKATSGVPNKVQLVWELVVNWITQLVKDNIGYADRTVIQLAITLFMFILLSNWLELIPSQHYLPAPTGDLNLTLALAAIVIVGVHVRSIRSKGFKGYIKHYFEPFGVLFLLNLIEEIVKPFTLALRLFGNIFAGGLMLSIIGLIPVYLNWPVQIIWKLFDMAIGGIQAFIFALLTVLYFATASESHADEDTALLNQEEAEEGTHGSAGPGRATVTLPTKQPETVPAQ